MMDEREVRQRLGDAASGFDFRFEDSERVVRRIKTRMLVTGVLAAVVMVAVVSVGATALTQQDGELAPRPQPPVDSIDGAPNVDYMLDLDTGEMTPLPDAILRSVGDTVHGGHYAASPTDSGLAYVGTDEEGNPQIFIADIDGTNVRQVTRDPTGAVSPAWSPDGTMIAYENFSGDGGEIFLLDVASGRTTQVTDTPACESCEREPQFTSDGSALIYTGGRGTTPVVRQISISGEDDRTLIGPGEGVTDAGNASLSPDGSMVTFLGGGSPESEEPGFRCGPCRFLADSDGTNRRVIEGWIASPSGSWSPDGSRIVTSDGGLAPGIDIIVTDIETGDVSPVGDGDWAIWLDDHTLLIEV
jgi:Tol biopolymer transport system component